MTNTDPTEKTRGRTQLLGNGKQYIKHWTRLISSESGPYSAIDPYVKPFFPPDPPEITALTGTPVLIDNEEIQTE